MDGAIRKKDARRGEETNNVKNKSMEVNVAREVKEGGVRKKSCKEEEKWICSVVVGYEGRSSR